MPLAQVLAHAGEIGRGLHDDRVERALLGRLAVGQGRARLVEVLLVERLLAELGARLDVVCVELQAVFKRAGLGEAGGWRAARARSPVGLYGARKVGQGGAGEQGQP